ncbi:Ger(x)C family spore germination protein [Paenibacillus hodogayensis]|uniref:Ger(X)C family spore germination protein n=1 Tax=Paenibacillus hodogayensis TaxID=279208 RepID=A0ABV5W6H0_9BACL
MNKRLGRWARLLLIAAAVGAAPGCYDRLDLEETTSPLLLGYDIDQHNNMLVYISNPVFNKNGGSEAHEIVVEASTSREARDQEDARSAGKIHGRKVQIVLVGQKMLQQADWFRMLDVFFRDARNTLTPRVIAYNGPLSEIIYLDTKGQPMLPLLLREIVDTKSVRSETVKTTLQDMHRQLWEKGITPYISQVAVVNGEVMLQGMALLDHQGKYAAALDARETILLRMLQNEVKRPVSLTIAVPGEAKQGPFHTDELSFTTETVNANVKTSYSDGRFQFDIRVDMRATLSELLLPMREPYLNEPDLLKSFIAEQVRNQLNDLVRKIKQHRIDPIGLGLYARAYAYEPYKQVEDRWGEALAGADIRIAVNAVLGSTGPVK